MQPLNGWIEVEVLEEFGIMKTVVDEFSPQRVKVIRVSLPWKDGDTVAEIKDIFKDNVILVSRMAKIILGDKEIFFVKNSDVVAIINEEEKCDSGT